MRWMLLTACLYGCGVAGINAARGTFATIRAAEVGYHGWALPEIERLGAVAGQQCHAAVNRTACVALVQEPTFSKLEAVDAALASYHAAERAAAKCGASGGEALTCSAGAVSAGVTAAAALGKVGFTVAPTGVH